MYKKACTCSKTNDPSSIACVEFVLCRNIYEKLKILYVCIPLEPSRTSALLIANVTPKKCFMLHIGLPVKSKYYVCENCATNLILVIVKNLDNRQNSAHCLHTWKALSNWVHFLIHMIRRVKVLPRPLKSTSSFTLMQSVSNCCIMGNDCNDDIVLQFKVRCCNVSNYYLSWTNF